MIFITCIKYTVITRDKKMRKKIISSDKKMFPVTNK